MLFDPIDFFPTDLSTVETDFTLHILILYSYNFSQYVI